jgi:hypothetical protein
MPIASVHGVNINYQVLEVDLFIEAWDEKREELASIFIDFLNRQGAR